MSSHAEEVGGWANDSERFVNEPCPDCYGEGEWDCGEPTRVGREDGAVVERRKQACPFCGGSGMKLKRG